MRLAAAYLVTLGIGLLSAVCAIPLSTSNPVQSGPEARSLQLRQPIDRKSSPIRARFIPALVKSEESHQPVDNSFAQELVRTFLNQEHYDLDPHDISWENTYEHDDAGMGTISFFLMDDIGGAICHKSCIGSLKIPAIIPAPFIHGVVAKDSSDWAKLNAKLFRA
ncbi:MAG: hypothetical protein NXY57DRAFT_6923 [Lentinula lateritia]|nr:MAG: hypothetical protein NXY57DRAFT_6923 [Lentinula lateritia]